MNDKEKKFDSIIDIGIELECLQEDLEPITKKFDKLIEGCDKYEDYDDYDYKKGVELVNAGFEQIMLHYNNIVKHFNKNKNLRKKLDNETYNKIYDLKNEFKNKKT